MDGKIKIQKPQMSEESREWWQENYIQVVLLAIFAALTLYFIYTKNTQVITATLIPAILTGLNLAKK